MQSDLPSRSGSLSASGRKRVIKRVVIKKIREPSPSRDSMIESEDEEFDELMEEMSPLHASSVARSISTSPAPLLSREDLRISTSQRSRNVEITRPQASLTPNRLVTENYEAHESAGTAQQLTNEYKNVVDATKSALLRERKRNDMLQSQLNILCDRELFDREEAQIDEVNEENKQLERENSLLKKQLFERERAQKSNSKVDESGLTLVDKLHNELRYLNKDNLLLKQQLRELQNKCKTYEKREIRGTSTIPELFYKLTGENVNNIDEALEEFAQIREAAVRDRLLNENLAAEIKRYKEENDKLQAERVESQKILENEKMRHENELSGKNNKIQALEKQVSGMANDYEMLIKEYKDVVMKASIVNETSFDYDNCENL